jgi:cell division septum initiation protein DivIVA
MSNVKEFMDAMSKAGISGEDALGAWRLAREAETEEKRLAREAEMEEKRLAREAEMEEKRLAREAEEKRLAREAEEKRLAREAEMEEKRLAREVEMEEKRVAAIERIASSSALSPEERMLALHSVRGGPSGQLALAAPKLVSFLCLFSLSLSVCVWLCVIL